MFKKVKLFFGDAHLLKKFLVILVGLVAFRMLAVIPVPQIDIGTVSSLLFQNQLLGIFNIFSGGGLSNVSIAMLGVFPYITVSIVTQLLTIVSPQLHSLYHEQGEIGRKKVNYWSRVATIPVSALNAVGILLYFQSQGVIGDLSTSDFALSVLFIVAGSALTMWIGELITEFGIGNGISFIVFAGIVVNIPLLLAQFQTTFDTGAIVTYVLVAIAIYIGTMWAVWMNEADRPVPTTYARHGSSIGLQSRQVETYLPIKVNPVGVLSIIFALTVAIFIQYLFGILANSSIAGVNSVALQIQDILANGYYYAIPVALLTVFFTYFHAPIVFNTKKIADTLQKQGAFVPGIRPGEETEVYLSNTLKKIICYAAIFLVVVAALPYLVTGSSAGSFLFTIGGTGALIVVSVLLDIYRKTSSRIQELEETNY